MRLFNYKVDDKAIKGAFERISLLKEEYTIYPYWKKTEEEDDEKFKFKFKLWQEAKDGNMVWTYSVLPLINPDVTEAAANMVIKILEEVKGENPPF